MKCVPMIAGVLLCAAAGAARAQYVPPQVSPYGNQMALPYVNLMQNRGGTGFNPAVSYLGIVQPQLQAQSAFQQMQNQINVDRSLPLIAPPRNTGISDTGTARARYMQYQQYFGTMTMPRNVSYQTQAGTTAATYGRR